MLFGVRRIIEPHSTLGGVEMSLEIQSNILVQQQRLDIYSKKCINWLNFTI